MSSFKKHYAIAIAGVMALGFGVQAQAATITFGSGQTFTDSSTLLSPTGGYAINFGGTAAVTTITSAAGTPVTFEGGPASTGSSSTAGLGSTSTSDVTVVNLGAADPTVASLANIRSSSSYIGTATIPTKASITDTGFEAVVGSALYGGSVTAGASAFEVTLHNLVVGNSYTMQIYTADDRTATLGYSTGFSNSFDTTTTPPSLVSPALSQYAYGATGNTIIGSYVLATFTADSTDQSFYENNYSGAGAAGSGQINALVLQDNSVSSPVPEPASLSLLTLGAAGLLARRRR